MFTKSWVDAYMQADNGFTEVWVCMCHNGIVFSGYCKENAENKRAAYYGQELPHHKIYLS